VFAYLDRVNVGIAALEMNSALKFTSATFGLGAGIFFIGYALFAVPANFVILRVGARRWVAAIAILWGLLACGTMLVRTPAQFYTVRLLLGVTEAGLFPGVIYYLSNWFPETYRARAIAGFTIAIPLSQAVGGPLGGALLTLNGASGFAGWQWLFLIEGLPSVLLGAILLGFLTERPEQAGWLSQEQRDWLVCCLETERNKTTLPAISPLRALGNGTVWTLSAPFFAYYTVSLAIIFWKPILIREALHTSDSLTASITGAIALCEAAAFPLCGMLSDRWGDRCALTALGLILATIGCAGLALLPHSQLMLLALFLVSLCNAVVMTSFWCLPTQLLKGPAAAPGIALLVAIGSTGGFFGPSLFGALRSATGSDVAGLSALAVLALLGSLMCMRLRRLPVFKQD
jgi:ACS family tartrate transporter-like MFS transporter